MFITLIPARNWYTFHKKTPPYFRYDLAQDPTQETGNKTTFERYPTNFCLQEYLACQSFVTCCIRLQK